MGNTLLGDDGAGIYAVRRLAEVLAASPAPGPGVRLAEVCAGGLDLVEAMLGYERVVVIDAWPALPPGEVRVCSLEDFLAEAEGPPPASLHQAGLPLALRTAAAMGLPVPRRVEIWAIGPEDISFREGCSRSVQAAVEEIVGRLLERIFPAGETGAV